MILKQRSLSNLSTNVSTLFAAVTNVVMEMIDTSTVSRAQLNIAAHYDLSNDMFKGFLSPDMSYSCPIWLLPTDAGYQTDNLEKAQLKKHDHIIEGLKIQPTDHVLEIGSGWGSFSIRAASTTGCRITTLTLSTAQKELADDRIAIAGLSEKVHVVLCDYQMLPILDLLFDKVVATKMIECSAEADLEVFFRRIDQLLKPASGICYI
jgi:cyclopropane-fatty-acyl-phospholipid synthase